MTLLETRAPAGATAFDAASLAGRYAAIRDRTERSSPHRCRPRTRPSSRCRMPAPPNGTAAHVTWFFETFLLLPHLPGYRRFREEFAYLFNSYYEAAGPRHARPKRGLLTRPAASEVGDYRAHVDAAMARLLRDPPTEALPLVELGLHHEEQHQELLLTDILHALSQNPLLPAYDPGWRDPAAAPGLPG